MKCSFANNGHLTSLKLDLSKYIEEHYFKFDSAYSEHQTNLDIYTDAVKPIVDFALSGRKVSCFAYGQTGNFIRKWKDVHNDWRFAEPRTVPLRSKGYF